MLAAGALAIAVYGFRYPVEELEPGKGGPLIITDVHGTILRTIPSADGRPGREAWVSLDDIPPIAVLAVLESEDARFFEHKGVDPVGMARAAWLDIKGRHFGYGGSTITMQLVRMLDSAGERRSIWNKLKESVLAMRLERAMDKRQILEQYLNRAYYANGAYGFAAASQTYFGKPAASLSAAEATLLAVIPRAPSAYDPMRHPAEVRARRDRVLALLVDKGLLGADEAERAEAQQIDLGLHPPPFLAPHFVEWVLAQLPDEVKQRGGTVRTTLDLPLQEQLEHRVEDHVASLADKSLTQAGMVVLDSQSGAVRAMVGSAGFFAENGEVNITAVRRHPGSSLKPFIYALAIAQGESPASITYDIADVDSDYRVAKLTQPEHGPVRYREALAGSYNLAAIHVLEKVGVERLLDKLRQAGVPLDGTPADYGLRMALGSSRVRLIDLASAYGFLVRGGKVTRPHGVVEVSFTGGTNEKWKPERQADRQLYPADVSWLVMDMLSDEAARHPTFGQELPLDDIGFPVAAKTGTSRGFADTVAVGVTREVTVAAWAGNFDGAPTQGLIAMQAAAPLVRTGMMLAARGRELTLPEKPDDVVAVSVCSLSGERPGAHCPHQKLEYFIHGTEPKKTCDWHQPDGVHYPDAVAAWAARQAERGGRNL